MATFTYTFKGCLPQCEGEGTKLTAPNSVAFKLVEQPNIADYPEEIRMELISVTPTTVDGTAGHIYEFEYDETKTFPILLKLCDVDGLPRCITCCDELFDITADLQNQINNLTDENTTYTLEKRFKNGASGDFDLALVGSDGSEDFILLPDRLFIDNAAFGGTYSPSGGTLTIPVGYQDLNGGIPVPTTTAFVNIDVSSFQTGDELVLTIVSVDGDTNEYVYTDNQGNEIDRVPFENFNAATGILTLTNGTPVDLNSFDTNTFATYDATTRTITFADGTTEQIPEDCCLTGANLNPTGGTGGTPIYEYTITNLVDGSTGLVTAPAGVSLDADNSLTVGADGLPYYNDLDVPATTITNNGDDTTISNGTDSVTVCNDQNKFKTIQDEDGRTHDADGCVDTLELHRTLNVGDQHTGSTGAGDISVAGLDSDESDTGTVSTDHDRVVIGSGSSSSSVTNGGVYSSDQSSITAGFSTAIIGSQESTQEREAPGLRAPSASTIISGFRSTNNATLSTVSGASATNTANGYGSIVHGASNANNPAQPTGNNLNETPNSFIFGFNAQSLLDDGATVQNYQYNFVFGDGQNTNSTRSYNFGDNEIYKGVDVFVQGQGNRVGNSTLTLADPSISHSAAIGFNNIIDPDPSSQVDATNLWRTNISIGSGNTHENVFGYSFGERAVVRHRKAMVLSVQNDSQAGSPGNIPVESFADGTITMMANGGYRLYTQNSQASSIQINGGASGVFDATGVYTPSDPDLKDNITPLDYKEAKDLFSNINAYTFNWKSGELNANGEPIKSAGVMATEHAKTGLGLANGELVNDKDTIGILIAMIQGQQEEIKEIKKRLEETEKKLA